MSQHKESGKIYVLLTALFLFGGLVRSNAQSASFMADGASDFIRREQLLGKVNTQEGLLHRSFAANLRALDTLLPAWQYKQKRNLFKGHSDIKLTWLPVSSTGQYNSGYPHGQNDGSMIPAKGVQMLLSGGVLLNAGKFSIQFKPELVYAQNNNFDGFPTEHFDVYWASYYKLLNRSDIPERFGDKSYHRLFWGQSAIRYNTGSFSVGISTENLWWGPGRYNALILSNNAPGFAHFTFNTIKPIRTGIGSFEGQLIGGNLVSSGIPPPDTNRYFNQTRLYQAKRNESRYVAGITVSWQPKWVKNLFMGFNAVSYLYHSDVSGIGDILPLKGIISSTAEKNGHKAALGSLFARYLMPADNAELYFEFGRNDKLATPFNIIADNAYPRAYVAGFRKLFNTKKKGQFIEFASEFTQIELPTAELIQQATSWYTDTYVRQGFTNNGQVLGAGIGPGSNSLLLDVSWVKGIEKVGIQIERVAHNEDFYYRSFTVTNDFTRHWIDISTTLHADWQKNRFLFSSKIALIRSLNYEWSILPDLGYFKNGYDVLNLHANLSVAYRW